MARQPDAFVEAVADAVTRAGVRVNTKGLRPELAEAFHAANIRYVHEQAVAAAQAKRLRRSAKMVNRT